MGLLGERGGAPYRSVGMYCAGRARRGRHPPQDVNKASRLFVMVNRNPYVGKEELES